MALLHPVSLVLLLGLTAVTARVEQPTNVTLQCRSLTNKLKWNYDHFQPELKFRVNISTYYSNSFPPVFWVKPPDLHADLSFLSDLEEAYLLHVTAVVGNEESDPAPSEEGITFSYNKNEIVDNNCFLDFPAVNVEVQPHHSVLLRFQHPWLSLHQKLVGNRMPQTRRKKSHDDLKELPFFDYVVIVNQQGHHTFSCGEPVCEEELPVDPLLDEHCLQINGDLESTLVKGQKVYCAQQLKDKAPSDHVYLVGIGVALSAVVIGGILYMVYYKKTRPSTQTPSIMTFGRPAMQRIIDPVQDSINQLEVTGVAATSPGTEEEDLSPPATQRNQYDSRLPIPAVDEDVFAELLAGQRGEEGSAYRQGNDLEEDETPNETSAGSAYEKREVLVEMGADEQATGYHAEPARGRSLE